MGILKNMVTAIKDVPSKLAGLSKQLGKGGFWSGLLSKALSGVGKFVTKFLESIKSLFTKKEMRPVLFQLGLIGGIGTYHEYSKENSKQSSKKEEEEFATLMQKQSTDSDLKGIVNTG